MEDLPGAADQPYEPPRGDDQPEYGGYVEPTEEEGSLEDSLQPEADSDEPYGVDDIPDDIPGEDLAAINNYFSHNPLHEGFRALGLAIEAGDPEAIEIASHMIVSRTESGVLDWIVPEGIDSRQVFHRIVAFGITHPEEAEREIDRRAPSYTDETGVAHVEPSPASTDETAGTAAADTIEDQITAAIEKYGSPPNQ